MENKHTPGPWAWQLFGDCYFLAAQHGNREILIGADEHPTMSYPIPVMNYNGILKPIDKDHPNAKLIAAAPELLEALIEISEPKGAYSLDRLEHAENTIKNIIEIAKEAIKKATE